MFTDGAKKDPQRSMTKPPTKRKKVRPSNIQNFESGGNTSDTRGVLTAVDFYQLFVDIVTEVTTTHFANGIRFK